MLKPVLFMLTILFFVYSDRYFLASQPLLRQSIQFTE